MPVSSPPLVPSHDQHERAHDATTYHASIEQQPSHEAFWIRTLNDPIAAFTLVLAVTTICLLIANLLLWLSTRKSVRLGRDEFNATHRPRLHIRNIVARDSAATNWGPAPAPYVAEAFALSPGEHINGQFYVSNVGNGPAIIVESHCEVLWNLDEGLPMERPYEGKDGNNPLGTPTIPSGSSAVGLFLSERPFTGLSFDRNGQSNIYVMGWVEYTDARNIRRRTAFCRRYGERTGSRRFYPVDDPDYEHEE